MISDALNRVFVWAQVAAKREEGQAMVEYGLIIALVAVLLVGTLVALKNGLEGTFNNIISNL